MAVLLILLSIFVIVGAVIMTAASLLAKRMWLAKFGLGGLAVWFALYGVMLLGSSLTSRERTLAVGDAKAFCGFYLDCHMHAMVTGVRTAPNIGDRNAGGMFYIVGVKVFSDAANPRVVLRLIEPSVRVTLQDGTAIGRDTTAEALLPSAGARLDRDITSKEFIEKELVFDVPQSAADPRLLITEGYGIDRVIEAVLIGDDDSVFHAQTFFKLQEQTAALRVN